MHSEIEDEASNILPHFLYSAIVMCTKSETAVILYVFNYIEVKNKRTAETFKTFLTFRTVILLSTDIFSILSKTSHEHIMSLLNICFKI